VVADARLGTGERLLVVVFMAERVLAEQRLRSIIRTE